MNVSQWQIRHFNLKQNEVGFETDGPWHTLDSKDKVVRERLEIQQKSSKDIGLIARPLLYPTLETKPFDTEDFVLLFKDDWNMALMGALYMDMLPFLDGRNTVDKLVKELQEKGYSELQIKTALYRLSSKGLILSGEHSLTEGQVEWWMLKGVSPVRAEQLLQDFPIFFKTLSGPEVNPCLLDKMSSWGGWNLTGDEREAGLVVYLMTPGLEHQLDSINKTHLSSGQKWCFLQMTGRQTLYTSPIFHPGHGPCWQCLHSRLKGGASRIAHHWRAPVSPDYKITESLLGHVHTELSFYLADPSRAPISNHLIRSIFPHTQGSYHPVERRPQCGVCGDATLKNSERSPEKICLQMRPLENVTGMGVRHQSHEVVWQKYKKFLDPLTGVTGEMTSYKEESGGVFSTTCGVNVAVKQWDMKGIEAGFRMNNGGKGTSVRQTEVGALCEALERYSGYFQGEEEIVHPAKYRDFSPGDAILPNKLMLFSQRQFQDREAINAQSNKFYRVPLPYSPDFEEPICWTPVWSLSETRFKYMMTRQLYYGPRFQGENNYTAADSNGCAGGSCLEDAIIQGTYEVIERDAVAMWWYNRIQFPGIDWNSFDLPYLQKIRGFFKSQGWNLWALDITNDFDIPCVVSVAAREAENPMIIFGMGCHSSPAIALSRAVMEMNQFWTAMRPWSLGQSKLSQHFSQSYLDWFEQADPYNDSSFAYLLPNDKPSRMRGDYSHPYYGDALEEIACLQGKVEERGMEMLVLDQTRPDIGYSVVKVIIPGMRHFWCRTAPGRLYDVPVKMGWIERPHHEEELNPIAMFL